MDRLYRIITEVTLTTPLPPPYKMLYRFENMTEGLKVSSHYRKAFYIHTTNTRLKKLSGIYLHLFDVTLAHFPIKALSTWLLTELL